GVSTPTWRKITENVLNKAETNRTLASYYKDHKDEYICSNCYNVIVVNASSAFKELAVEEVMGNDPPIVSFSKFRSVVESKNDRLSFFFNEIEAMAVWKKN
ncbi:18271_t:CDS:2, partial [Gigaspora rosea]